MQCTNHILLYFMSIDLVRHNAKLALSINPVLSKIKKKNYFPSLKVDHLININTCGLNLCQHIFLSKLTFLTLISILTFEYSPIGTCILFFKLFRT